LLEKVLKQANIWITGIIVFWNFIWILLSNFFVFYFKNFVTTFNCA
jgi:hypothetical protein